MDWSLLDLGTPTFGTTLDHFKEELKASETLQLDKTERLGLAEMGVSRYLTCLLT